MVKLNLENQDKRFQDELDQHKDYIDHLKIKTDSLLRIDNYIMPKFKGDIMVEDNYQDESVKYKSFQDFVVKTHDLYSEFQDFKEQHKKLD
jgi:hypothetical protein